jgi:hypothetical protein
MKNIHLIQTHKTSRLIKFKDETNLLLSSLPSIKGQGFNIYITNDETWNDTYINELKTLFELYDYKLKDKNILLVEAGVIRGSNYKFIIDYIKNTLNITNKIYTLALFENSGSVFKSDFVGEYYDDSKEDLTFWWEMYNNHWK